MSTVDNKVVSMRFDNSQFEKNLSTSVSSLDRLKSALNFAGQIKDLVGLQKSANDTNFTPLGSAVDGISAKFAALSTVAITTLANITNRAVDAGIRIGKSLSIDQVNAGFQEYELKMGSIQTIMANTARHGTTLEQVNSTLDELNTYADKTIYNFGDMTKNIGLFTNAGIKVEDATSMIKGFSNEAAASGTNAQQAAGAAYQLSQALSSGTIRLMDWRSLTNAGMGNKNMQQGLIDVAHAMGTLEKGSSTSELAMTKFNDSLEQGWLSADVMQKYLTIQAGEMDEVQMKALGLTDAQAAWFTQQAKTAEEAATKVRTFTQLMGTLKEGVGSSWGQSFGLILGDFNQATDLFSGLYQKFDGLLSASAKSRNDLITGWVMLGGRDQAIETLYSLFKSLGSILTPIKEAFRAVFPPQTPQTLFAITTGIQQLIKGFEITADTAATLRTVFTAVFSVFEILWTVVKEVGKTFLSLGSSISAAVGSEGVGKISDLSTKIIELHARLVQGGGIAEIFDKIRKSIGKFFALLSGNEYVEDTGDALGTMQEGLKFGSIDSSYNNMQRITDTVKELSPAAGALTIALQAVKRAFAGLWEDLLPVRDALSAVVDLVSNEFSTMWDGVADKIKNGGVDSVLDATSVGLLGGIGLLLKKIFTDGVGLNFDFSGGIFGGVTDVLDDVSSHLKVMQAGVSADIILKIAMAVGVLAGSIFLLAMLDADQLKKSLAVTTVSLAELIAAMKAFSAINVGLNMPLLVVGLLGLSASMVILSFAVRNLSGMSWDEITRGVSGLAGMLVSLAVSTNLLSGNASRLLRVSISLIALAAGVAILTKPLMELSGLSWAELGKGLAGVSAAMIVLALTTNLLPDDVGAKAFMLMGFAKSVDILSQSVKLFGEMDLVTMAQGLGAVAATLLIVSTGTRLLPKNLPAVGVGMTLIGVGLKIITSAVKDLGGMNTDELAYGLLAVMSLMATMALTSVVMSSAVGGAVAFGIVAASLMGLSVAVKILGSMPIMAIVTAVGAMVLVMAVIAGSAVLLSAIAPMIFVAGAALAVFGLGLLLFSAAAAVGAAALATLAAAGVGGITVFFEFLKQLAMYLPEIVTMLATTFVKGLTQIVDLLPDLLAGIGRVLGGLLDMLTMLVPKIGEFLAVLFGELGRLILQYTPMLVDIGFNILLSLLSGLSSNITAITERVVEIITGFLTALANNIQPIIDAGVNLLLNFLSGIANNLGHVITTAISIVTTVISAITSNIPVLIEAGVGIVVAFIQGIGQSIMLIVNAGVQLVVDFLGGIASSITQIIEAGTGVVIAFIEGIGGAATDIVTAALQTLVTFLNALAINLGLVIQAGGQLITSLVTGIALQIPTVAASITRLIIVFLNEVGKHATSIMTAGANLIIQLINGFNSESQRIIDAVFEAILDFAENLAEAVEYYMPRLQDAGKRIIKAVADGFTFGFASKAWDVASTMVGKIGGGVKAVTGFLGINSPSKLFIGIGASTGEGYIKGVESMKTGVERSSVGMATAFVSKATAAVKATNEIFDSMNVSNPVITPTLDLSNVTREASVLKSLIPETALSPSLSYDLAGGIQRQRERQAVTNDDVDSPDTSDGPNGVTMIQNNYSPEALSTVQIYNQTRDLVTLTKEKMGIP